MRDRIPRDKPLQGFCKLTILLLLPWGVFSAPQHVKQMRAVSSDDAGEPENVKTSATSQGIKESGLDNLMNNAQSGEKNYKDENTDWISAIRQLFLKWGYNDEEIPEPFGSKKTTDMDTPSKEFSIILKGLQDSLPGDLKSPIQSIIHSDGIKLPDGTSSGKMTKLEEIDETIKEIEKDLMAKETVQSQSLPTSKEQNENFDRLNNSKNEGTTKAKNSQNDHKTFCAEVDGACEDEYDEEEPSTTDTSSTEVKHSQESSNMGLQAPSRNSSSQENNKLSNDEESLNKLIEDLKSIVEKSNEMTVDDSSKAKDDLIQISTLVHEIEMVAERKDMPCQSSIDSDTMNGTTTKSVIPDSDQQLQSQITEVSIQSTTTVSSKLGKDLDQNEKHIVDAMNRHPSSLDVSVVGNDIKEVGHQLGIIAEQERERAASNTLEASFEEKKNIEELFKEIDKKGHKVGENDRSHPDLHKQVDEIDNLISDLHGVHLTPNPTVEAQKKHEKTHINTDNTDDSETPNNFSKTDPETKDLSNMLNIEMNEVSKINKAHEKHKAEMLRLIKKLKLSNNTESESKKIHKIEGLIEDIDREHHNSLQLEEKLSKLSTEEEVEHIHMKKHGHNSKKHHESIGKKLESLEKIGDSLASNVDSSKYDTRIEERLHSKKIKSKESKHHTVHGKSDELAKALENHNDDSKKFQDSSITVDSTIAPLEGTIRDTTDLRPASSADDLHSGTEGSPMKNYLNESSLDQSNDQSQYSKAVTQDAKAVEFLDTNSPVLREEVDGSQNGDSKVQNQKLNLDELALEPAEVNYNGGIHAKINDMINQHPEGIWPNSDGWKTEHTDSQFNSNLVDQVSEHQEVPLSGESNENHKVPLSVGSDEPRIPLQENLSEGDSLIEKIQDEQNRDEPNNFGLEGLHSENSDAGTNNVPENGNHPPITSESTSEHKQKDNSDIESENSMASHPILPLTHNDLNIDDDQENSNANSHSNGDGTNENVNTFNLERDIEMLENPERVHSLINVLDNGPAESKFPDFHGLSQHESLKTDQGLSPEKLEKIIESEHGMAQSVAKTSRDTSSYHHHVQEHGLLENAPPKLKGHKSKHRKRLFNRVKKKIRRDKSEYVSHQSKGD